MHTYNNKIRFCWILLIASVLLNGCSKNDTDATTDLYAYTASGNVAYNILDGSSIAILRNMVLPGGNTAFPVLLTRAFTRDITVKAKIDTSLAAAYFSGSKDMTSALAPAGAFTLANGGEVHIPAGQTASADSIQIILADGSKLLKGQNDYLVPVALESATEGIPTSLTRQVMYVRLKVVAIAAGIAALDGTNLVRVVLNRNGGVNTGPDAIYLQGILNNSVSKPLTIKVKSNEALVVKYNSANGTDYSPFPAGSYTLGKTGANIPAGSLRSSDSILVELPDLAVFKAGKDYLLPVEAVDSQDPTTPPVDSARAVVYLRLSVLVNNINASNVAVQGTIMDRKDWTASASNAYFGYYPAGNAIDGDGTSFWIGDGVPNWLQIDMQALHTVKAFAVSPIPYDDLRKIEIYASDNGLSWTSEGIYFGANQAGVSVTKNIGFIKPVTARYFKFNVTGSASGTYAGMADIQAYQ